MSAKAIDIALNVWKYVNPLTLCALYISYKAINVSAEAEMLSELAAVIILLGFAFPALIVNLVLNRLVRKLSLRITLNIVAAVILYGCAMYVMG